MDVIYTAYLENAVSFILSRIFSMWISDKQRPKSPDEEREEGAEPLGEKFKGVSRVVWKEQMEPQLASPGCHRHNGV